MTQDPVNGMTFSGGTHATSLKFVDDIMFYLSSITDNLERTMVVL
jgi:hypothetical protein